MAQDNPTNGPPGHTTVGEGIAMLWRERYRRSVARYNELEKRIEELEAAVNVADGRREFTPVDVAAAERHLTVPLTQWVRDKAKFLNAPSTDDGRYEVRRFGDIEVTMQKRVAISPATSVVCQGVTVKLEDQKSGKKMQYTLVTANEADLDQQKISTASPIGMALLGKGVGEIVDVQVPAGTLTYEILDIF